MIKFTLGEWEIEVVQEGNRYSWQAENAFGELFYDNLFSDNDLTKEEIKFCIIEYFKDIVKDLEKETIKE